MSSSPEPLRVRLARGEAVADARIAGDVPLRELLQRERERARVEVEAACERGREEARREVAAEVAAFVEGCRGEVAALREALLDTAVELGTAMAEAVLHRELAGGADLSAAVRACLDAAGSEPSSCAVRVHPDALPALERDGVAARVELVADPELQAGEVRLDTPVGTLVHDPREALERARDTLLTELARPEAKATREAA